MCFIIDISHKHKNSTWHHYSCNLNLQRKVRMSLSVFGTPVCCSLVHCTPRADSTQYITPCEHDSLRYLWNKEVSRLINHTALKDSPNALKARGGDIISPTSLGLWHTNWTYRLTRVLFLEKKNLNIMVPDIESLFPGAWTSPSLMRSCNWPDVLEFDAVRLHH